MTTIFLLIILALTLILPFAIKAVEHNLEVFIFLMGLFASIASGVLSIDNIVHILENRFLYMITAAVLIISFVFKIFKEKIKKVINFLLVKIPLKLFAFLLVFILGLASSVITAIIAALLLVEIISILPLKREDKIKLNIIACFSIGLGAALTPIGEPIATIVVSKLNVDFTYLIREIGVYAFAAIILLSIAGTFMVSNGKMAKRASTTNEEVAVDNIAIESEVETNKEIIIRAVKIFLFIIGLELLGNGFKPLIDVYIIGLDSRLLYWGNTVSAILDNATIAAAEISPKMNSQQIKAILMGLLISGGMLIPGNIPNIITAGKLKIKSSEWMKVGLPIGFAMLIAYYIVLFVF